MSTRRRATSTSLTSPGIFACFTRRRQAALAALDDGGVRPADLPQRPHRRAGDRGRPGHHRAASPATGAARGRRWTASTPSTRRRGAWSGPPRPASQPKDNSFALPSSAGWDGSGSSTAGTGDGNVVCVNARTGRADLALPVSAGGQRLRGALQGQRHRDPRDENLDSSDIGRMVAVKLGRAAEAAGAGAVPGPPSGQERRGLAERRWPRSPARRCSSATGSTRWTRPASSRCVDANTGKILWQHKLAPDQLHASPLYADGKLYVPMQNGLFYILRPRRDRTRTSWRRSSWRAAASARRRSGTARSTSSAPRSSTASARRATTRSLPGRRGAAGAAEAGPDRRRCSHPGRSAAAAGREGAFTDPRDRRQRLRRRRRSTARRRSGRSTSRRRRACAPR